MNEPVLYTEQAGQSCSDKRIFILLLNVTIGCGYVSKKIKAFFSFDEIGDGYMLFLFPDVT
jgi:hypothetical protein